MSWLNTSTVLSIVDHNLNSSWQCVDLYNTTLSLFSLLHRLTNIYIKNIWNRTSRNSMNVIQKKELRLWLISNIVCCEVSKLYIFSQQTNKQTNRQTDKQTNTEAENANDKLVAYWPRITTVPTNNSWPLQYFSSYRYTVKVDPNNPWPD